MSSLDQIGSVNQNTPEQSVDIALPPVIHKTMDQYAFKKKNPQCLLGQQYKCVCLSVN